MPAEDLARDSQAEDAPADHREVSPSRWGKEAVHGR
jgi:hypothetical protein